MKLKQEARVLRRKALSSLTVATTAFNSPVDEGRVTQVLLSLQHCFEMLLKAALVQNGVRVFDKQLGRSIGFEACIRQALNHPTIRLTDAEAGTLRAIDAMRDDEQHWFNEVSEQLLYLHARAGITLVDDLLQRVFGEHLADHLPSRVLPLSVDPPRDLAILIDEEYTQVATLLAPGRRASHEARARIRTLLAMEAHVEPETQVSSKDVDRVEKGIKAGQSRTEVFPRLDKVATRVRGSGVTLTVHFTKKAGAPVRYVSDESSPAAAIREVDLARKFYLSASDLAAKVGLTGPRSTALRRHLGIDQDPGACHVFVFDSQRIPRFSDNAYRAMKEASEQLDMAAVWDAHKPAGRRSTPRPCAVEGCAA
ncbi:hypothetical protein [Puerhibacterium sp. TATVAM-FAB25]|uniref:hypothetical protein n=1 Tax=Puerhibacterium sp. TATVAM-FAB25 TaxID=3093699 RepID=UPI003978DF97